jgi:GMP synthase-like glutamine amidotransferase
MTIAILETGTPPAELIERFGRYDAMFEHLLGGGFGYQSFPVFEGVYPGDPERYSGVVITGSPAGVYEDLPWIGPLESWLQHAAGKVPMVGVCFGHQVMAQAFGGKVIKSPKGRGNGLHRYELTDGFTIGGLHSVAAPASHGDQVVELAPRTKVLGGNDFNPYGILEYPFRAVSMQFHPEFEPAYAKALIESRRGGLVAATRADAALASLDQPNDNAVLGRWMADFLRG